MKLYNEEDRYAIAKGKALTMVREFQKVYPRAPLFDRYDRIAIEVWYAVNEQFPKAQEIDTMKVHAIITELRRMQEGT